jgi:demethylmenaquinone methyltransferase/2-methoxy-6-polyprenyl-1,4-benzoquinol methylase
LGADPLESLLAEQVAYYRAVAHDYGEMAIPGIPLAELEAAHDELVAALHDFHPTGDVLELACGPGTWTPLLAGYAKTLTAVDASPEMLRLAAAAVEDPRVRFLRADLFSWEPDRHYDQVFFGFWLSHVPLDRFASFWGLVDRCLKPGGRVAFADDGYRTADELIEDQASEVIQRRLGDGTAFRAVKVPHTPESLEHRLRELGWSFRVRYVGGPAFWGCGRRVGEDAPLL